LSGGGGGLTVDAPSWISSGSALRPRNILQSGRVHFFYIFAEKFSEKIGVFDSKQFFEKNDHNIGI
jgi:hypothetical protein